MASAPDSRSKAGYSGDVAVTGRRPAWWPSGLALGARPWPYVRAKNLYPLENGAGFPMFFKKGN